MIGGAGSRRAQEWLALCCLLTWASSSCGLHCVTPSQAPLSHPSASCELESPTSARLQNSGVVHGLAPGLVPTQRLRGGSSGESRTSIHPGTSNYANLEANHFVCAAAYDQLPPLPEGWEERVHSSGRGNVMALFFCAPANHQPSCPLLLVPCNPFFVFRGLV
jgi:hypothetical protein